MKNEPALNNSGGCREAETPQVSKQIRKECLRLLTRRDHSRKEIQDKLAFKGYNRSEVSSVVDELSQQSWQDDKRYAESYARVRSQKGFGPVRIAYELRQQGIEAETIEDIVRSMESVWQDILMQVFIKKYAKLETVDSNERSKRIRFLLQRGFSSAMINDLF
jgi:regulatory protein